MTIGGNRINGIYIDAVLHEYDRTNHEIARLKEYMVELEGQLVKVVGKKDEGSQTFKYKNYSVVTTQGFSRRVDIKKFESVHRSLTQEEIKVFHQAFTLKPSINLANYRKVQESNPKLFFKLSEAVTTSQNKVAVKVKINEDKD